MSFPRYPKYKDSGIAWLGEVPEGWQVMRLRFAVKVNPSKSEMGPLPADTSVSFFPMEAINVAGPPNASAERTLAEVETGYTYFRDGDIAFAKITPCFENGKRALFSDLTNGIGFGTTELIVLRPDGFTDARFLYWLCASPAFMLPAEGSMYGTGGQKRVSDAFVRDFPLSLPPPNEQRQIAAFLDQETAKIDALIDEQRQLIELLTEKRQAVISHAVTKGPDPLVPMKNSGVSWLGKIPITWDVIPLGYFVKFFSGGTPDKTNENFWNGSVPWVSPKDMKVEVIADTQDHVTDEAVNRGGLHLYHANHVLIVVRGMILAHTFPVARNSVPVTINQDMKAILCGDRIEPEFLQKVFLGLNGLIVSLTDESAHGTLKLESSVLNNILIAVPTVEEQKSIVAWLNKQTTRLDALIASATDAIKLLQERRSTLISAAVTGKINVSLHTPKPAQSTWTSGFARQVIAAEALTRCNGPRMGRIKLQKLIHLCEYHAQLDEIRGDYSRKAAGPFDPQVMASIRKGLKQQRWFEEYKDGDRYAYRPLEKSGGHQQYLQHWEEKQAKIEEVLNLLGGARTRTCEIASTLYAAWNDLLIEGKNPTDAEIIHEASSAERWHASKEKIAADKWSAALAWMREKGLVPIGYGAHTKHKVNNAAEEIYEPA